MTRHVGTKDRVVLVALALLLIAGIAGAGFWNVKQRADNAYTAMARGQYKLARQYYEEEAEAGSPRAMNHLANLHYLGLGIDQNLDTAAQLYLDASAKGFAPAQLNLGHLYRQGIGVPHDPLRAFGWYQMSNIHGSPWGEQYLRQTALEFTLTPGQINKAQESWPTLSSIVSEGL